MSKLEDLKTVNDLNEGVLLYLTYSGSKLYGTENKNSDKDLFGLYIPNKPASSFTYTTGGKDSKNTNKDIDVEVYSIDKFKKSLANGELHGIEIYFSFFREDLHIVKSNVVEELKEEFDGYTIKSINRILRVPEQELTSYAKKQVQLAEYQELCTLIMKLKNDNLEDMKLGDILDDIEKHMVGKKYKFIDVIRRKKDSLLMFHGLKFTNFMKLEVPMRRLEEVIDNLNGNKTSAAKGISHGLRLLWQLEELISTGFITFPLDARKTDVIKSIKEGKITVDIIDMYSSLLKELDGYRHDVRICVPSKL